MSDPTSLETIELTPGAATFLVGDLDGSRCRLALAQGDAEGNVNLFEERSYRFIEGRSEDAFASYLSAIEWTRSLQATVLAATSDAGEQSTNIDRWRSVASLTGASLGQVRVIGDYSALLLSVDHLAGADLKNIGPALRGDRTAPVTVLGAGAKFGAGVLAPGRRSDVLLTTEGGHVTFAPGDDVEVEILRVLMRTFGRVAVECLLSEAGLVNLYRALGEIAGYAREELSPADIVRGAEAGDRLSELTVKRYCAIYGAVAGDFALAYGASGGVYLGGCIATPLAATLERSAFRERFEQKGRFSGHMAQIPTRIILRRTAALIGAAYLAWDISAGSVERGE